MGRRPSNKTLIHRDYINKPRNRAKLIQERNQLARLTNSRLRALEKHGMTYGAYKYTQPFLKGQKQKYFSAKANAKFTDKQLIHEISIMQSFLRSASSSVRGINRINKKRMETFEKNGIHFESTEEFMNFIQSSAFNEFRAYYPSDERGVADKSGFMQHLNRVKGSHSWSDVADILEKFRSDTSIAKNKRNLDDYLKEYLKE